MYLARRGAQCTAVDLSSVQLAHARALAESHGVHLDLIQADIAALPLSAPGMFELVHSTYALPFVGDPQAAVRAASDQLRPGGWFLLTTAHPVWSGEWIEVDQDEAGVFLVDYFQPPSDARVADSGPGRSVCRAVPLSDVFTWLVEAQLVVRRLLEPKALPVADMGEREVRERVPYDSVLWRERQDDLQAVPFVAVFLAQRT